jgi:hypothetical protein
LKKEENRQIFSFGCALGKYWEMSYLGGRVLLACRASFKAAEAIKLLMLTPSRLAACAISFFSCSV